MKTLYLFACSIAFVSMLGAQTGGSGSVEGQVLSSADGTPVRRAVVNMQRSSAIFATLPGQPPRQQAQPLQTETDEQGHFAFRDLEAGGYRIMVQRQGLVSQNSGAELWLGEGQRLTGYVVRATPQSVIAGKVTDENGDPVMGASVSAQRSGTTASGRVVTAGSAQSNDLGQFRIANLSAGDYLVAASYRDQSRMMYAGNQTLPDKPQFVYAATYHPSTAVAREAETVHVPDGGGVISGVDIKLVKTEGYSIRATVNDPGAPANGAVAYPNLRPRDPTTAPGGCCFGGMRQQDGSFLFTGVPPGSYVMTAQRNNPGTPGAAASANLPIEVRDRNLEGIILEVKPNADLQGAVRIEPQGACNASNMTVNLRPPGTNNGQVYGSIPQPAQVGSDLRFTLKNVAPGEYSVNVNGAMNRCYVKSVLYGGQSAPAGALTVGDGGSLEIVLGPYNAQLSVRAVDRDGNPVPGARITAVPKDAGAVNAQVGSRTSQGGQASMMSLRPGTYEVLAFENPDPSNAIYMPNPGGATGAYEGRGKTVTVGESGRSVVEVTVIPASETGAAAAPPPGAKGSLAGKVVNAVNGSPLAGVVVTLRGMFSQAVRASTPSMATDDQGRFAFADLAPGVYNVSAVEQRFVAASPGPLSGLTNQVVVGDGQQVAAYILKLAPAGVIAGTIKDEGGEPALGARVTACRYRNQMNQRRLVQAGSAVTDDLGAYRIVNLSAGEYYLSVQRAQPARGVANRSLISVQGALSEVSTWPGNGAQATPDSITGALPTEPETDYAPMWYHCCPRHDGPVALSAENTRFGGAPVGYLG